MMRKLTLWIALAALSLAPLPNVAAGWLPLAMNKSGYTGPADAISANLLGCWSLRACSSATRGNRVANVCNIPPARRAAAIATF
jgi:hypothetical protein